MLDITLKCRQEPLSIRILIVILVRLHARAGVMRKVIGLWLTLQRPSAGACDNSEVDSTPKWLQKSVMSSTREAIVGSLAEI